MEVNIIGREEEKLLLDSIIANKKADLAAVYGRRRIGKTYLSLRHDSSCTYEICICIERVREGLHDPKQQERTN